MEKCIDKFLMNKIVQDKVERHSDSSDFEETQTVPFISTSGKRSLFDKKIKANSRTREKATSILRKSESSNPNHIHSTSSFDISMIPVRDNINQNVKKTKRDSPLNSRRYEKHNTPQETFNTKEIQYKPTQCFSNIFRRYNNNVKQISSFKTKSGDNLNTGNVCANCERRRIKKLNRRRRNFVVQPVYTVDNIQAGPVPFGHENDQAPLSQHGHKMRKQDSNTSHELTSSESEIVNTDQRTHHSRQQNFIERFQKEMRKEYLKYEKEFLKDHVQQYPSKRGDFANSVFSTPLYRVMKEESTTEAQTSFMRSASSGFWDYLYEKICGKHMASGTKPCICFPPSALGQEKKPVPLAEGFGRQESVNKTDNKPTSSMPDCKSCIEQTDDPIKKNSQKLQSFANTPLKINTKCECRRNKKRRKQTELSKNKQESLTQADDVTRPCQEPHDDIIRTVEEKYNGEILCIHNPPCILINGCLNLPAGEDTSTIQGNFWPVMQDKKTSFYHICRRLKRPKRNCEQACQYHPPSIEVQRAAQVKSEKVVQSICSHNPPCEVVYGCYKAKRDPKLDNSCIHVPMCERLPECLVKDNQEKDAKEKLCNHKPKCTEIPLCSRKFVVLTARDTVGTQVRPKTKLVCRHEPPCIMIPRCLARILSTSYVPYDAIPDCVHQPCCDMIPACCRKAAKEMVSASSQYPSAPCRIV